MRARTERILTLSAPRARRCRTDRATAAMGRLEAAIEAACVEVRLRPGDVLLLDNRRAVHSRSSYEPQFDGVDRWLQRVWSRPETFVARTGDMPSPDLFA